MLTRRLRLLRSGGEAAGLSDLPHHPQAPEVQHISHPVTLRRLSWRSDSLLDWLEEEQLGEDAL